MEDRLREMLREHERTYHAALPGGVAAFPEGWSTVAFVALISRAVARAVEVAIRVHRESSQLHRLEDGQARGFDARILAGVHQPESEVGDEPRVRAFLQEGRAVARVVNAALGHHIKTFHATSEGVLPRLGSPDWVDLYRN